jgi:hypothetical protein
MLPVLKKRRLRKATKFSGTPSLFLARGAVSIYQTSPPAFSTAATAEFDWPAFCTALPDEQKLPIFVLILSLSPSNFSKNKELIYQMIQVCTLSAKDLGATKNPAVDLELILVHHFSRILCLDASSAL